MSSIVGPCREG